MRVSGLSPTRVGARFQRWRIGLVLFGLAVAWGSWGAAQAQAQQWRSRISSRVQYVEAQTLVRDSVLFAATTIDANGRRAFGDIVVTCIAGAEYCYYYRSGFVANSAPAVLDVDLNVFGFGVQGLRAYVSTRFRTDLGEQEFWPRVKDNFDLLAGYLEYNHPRFRVRAGRDYEVSGLGYYGYDGGSLMFRIPAGQIELEAYGGWGLERGVPEPITNNEFGLLGVFQPEKRNYLWGIRGSARPTPSSSIELIYQAEEPGQGPGVLTERFGLEGTWQLGPDWSIQGHADYDIVAGLWGKAGLKAGWQAHRMAYLEAGYIRYRPVFSLQTIWMAFSPVAYNGWNASVGLFPLRNLTFKLWLERRDYGKADAEVPFFATTDRDWRYGIRGSWRPPEFLGVAWDIDGGYWRNHGFGSALNSGDLRVGIMPHERLSLGLRMAAWQQLQEFRLAEGRVLGFGLDARWRTRPGTVWFSVDRYDHNQHGDAALTDWSQWRSALGFSYYLGSEPGRAP